jgi:hypothetical protein
MSRLTTRRADALSGLNSGAAENLYAWSVRNTVPAIFWYKLGTNSQVLTI